MFARLWEDETAVIAVEYLLLLSIVGLGLVAGLTAGVNSLTIEFTEMSNAVLALDQSYSYSAASGCTGSHGGVTVTDSPGHVCVTIIGGTTAINVTVIISTTATP
jgi:Flp pilus assembly pilin Flp